MKNSATRWILMASALVTVAALNLACSSSSDNGGGMGGATGTDAGSGTGGKTTSGAGGTVVHVLQYNFDSSVEMWSLSNYPDSPARNLGATYATDGGGTDAQVFGDGGLVPVPTIGFDSATGSPNPGSLKVTATFTDCNQYVDAVVNLPTALNLTGKTLNARLAVLSGGFSGGAQLHISTGANYAGYVKAAFVLGTTPGTYGAAALDTRVAVSDTTTTADYTTVVQAGVQIFSGGACTATVGYMNAGELVTFSIDSVTD